MNLKEDISSYNTSTAPPRIVVMKFGGASLATAEHIRRAADRALQARRSGMAVVVVVSAMFGETNRLLALTQELGSPTDLSEIDVVAATGEQVAAGLMALAIQKAGGRARSFLGHQVRILTDSRFGEARVRAVENRRLQEALENGEIPVVAGFQGVDAAGNLTTLGRGGSDTTAVAVAASLPGAICEIYKEVDGVYTADPNLCPSAHKLSSLSYDHMLTLASLGAKVLQGRSVALAQRYGVPLRVRPAADDGEGTWITDEWEDLEAASIRTLACDRHLSRLRVGVLPETQASLVEALGEAQIPLEMGGDSPIQGGDGSSELWFVLRQADVLRGRAVLEGKRLGKVRGEDHLAKVSLVGQGLHADPDLVARMARELRQKAVPFFGWNMGELRASFFIPAARADVAVQALHQHFIFQGVRT